MTQPYRLAILAYYPMPFQSAFFRALSRHPDIELMVYYLIGERLDGTRHNVDFRAHTSSSPSLLDGYRYEALANFSPMNSLSSTFRFVNPSLVSRLCREQWDAILISGWNYLPQLVLGAIPAKFRMPFLLRTDTNGVVTDSRHGNALVRALRSMVVSNASAILYTSSANRAYYERAGVSPRKLFFSPFAVDNDEIAAQFEAWSPRKLETRQGIGISNTAPVLTYAGKLIAWKRPELVLQGAASLLRERRMNLVFVGDGEARPRLEAFVTEQQLPNVFFLGFVPNSEVPRYLAASDIFALLSPQEPFGLVINEAMLCHNALLISETCGSAADLVREHVNGHIIRSNSPEEVSAALSSMLADPRTLLAYGEASARMIGEWKPDHAAYGVVEALRAVSNRPHTVV